MAGEPDTELMLRVKGGDLAAFESLYARYSRPLTHFFHRLTWDRGASEDLMQETFLRLWNGRRHYRPIGRFTTWLFQIGKNHWLNEREKRRRRIAPVSLETGGEAGGSRLREAVPALSSGPAEQAFENELSAAFAAALADLSEKLRIVFVMAQVEGMRYADIAEILGIPVGTVKSRMANAEQIIRGRLSGYLGEGGGTGEKPG